MPRVATSEVVPARLAAGEGEGGLTRADVVQSECETEVSGLTQRPPTGLLQKVHGLTPLGAEGGDSWLQQPGGVRMGGRGRHRGCQLRQVVPLTDFS